MILPPPEKPRAFILHQIEKQPRIKKKFSLKKMVFEGKLEL